MLIQIMDLWGLAIHAGVVNVMFHVHICYSALIPDFLDCLLQLLFGEATVTVLINEIKQNGHKSSGSIHIQTLEVNIINIKHASFLDKEII